MRRTPGAVLALLTLLTATGCGSASSAGTVTVTSTVTVTPAPASSPPTEPASTSSPASATPGPASLRPFVGTWSGHTRFLEVTSAGRAVEHVGDGCCNPIIDLTMRVGDPRRSGKGWVATTTLVSVDVHPGWKDSGRPAPRAGDHGTLTLEDGLLTDSVTSVTYCNQAQAEKGACGA